MKYAPNHIRVWRFEDAPEELKNLSKDRGDEDWLALVPPKLTDTYIPWLQQGAGFGVYCVEVHSHPELPEYQVHIGSH